VGEILQGKVRDITIYLVLVRDFDNQDQRLKKRSLKGILGFSVRKKYDFAKKWEKDYQT